MSPTTRIVLFNFWEYVAFLANTFVFLLIGLEIDIATLASQWQTIAIAIATVVLARAIVSYGLGWLAHRLPDPVPLRWLHVINWGGLRGAIALALALSLPVSLGPQRELIRLMAFGVVLFTLLVQSTTMRPILRWLKIVMRDPIQIEYEMQHARMMAFRSAAMHLDRMQRDGFLSNQAWETLRPDLIDRAEEMAHAVRRLQRAHPQLGKEELGRARQELLRAQRAALLALRRDGIVSEEVFESLVAEVDADLANNDHAPSPPAEESSDDTDSSAA